MLRSSTQSLSRGLRGVRSCGPKTQAPLPRSSPVRNQSTSPGGSGGGGSKALLGLGAVSVAAVGATVGYSSVDSDFRRLVEDVVPGSRTVLDTVLGELEPEKPQKKPVEVVPSKKRPPATVPTTSTVPPPPIKAEKSETPLPATTPPSPPLEKPSFAKSEVADAKKKEEEPKMKAPVAEQKKQERPKAEVREETVVQEKAPLLTSDNKEFLSNDDESTIKAGKDLHRRVSGLKEELEVELRLQLKRQAEVHADHIADAMQVQKNELERQHQRALDEALESAVLGHRQELASVMGHVRGLQKGLEGRSKMDMASLEAQELWLACTSLLTAVEADPGSTEIRAVGKELAAVKAAGGEDGGDQFVKAVLDAIPGVVAERGVYTDSSLRERFLRVEKMAKRTALIGEDGGSLFRYALSYLQSLFIIDPATDRLPGKHDPVDVDALSTFDLVWLARGSLDRGDLDQAVRYVSLLKGQPSNVSRDWVNEARILLETKQACKALLVHAAAVGVEALPKKK